MNNVLNLNDYRKIKTIEKAIALKNRETANTEEESKQLEIDLIRLNAKLKLAKLAKAN